MGREGLMRTLFTRSDFKFVLAAAICAYGAMSARSEDHPKQPKSNNEIAHCKRIHNEMMRMRCYEEMNSKIAPLQRQPVPSGTWQVTRTPNPAGGPDAISISKITNVIPPDQNIAGIMLRCGEGATTEVVVVLVTPLPSRSHPKVTVTAGTTTTEFTASVVTPGTLVLLPEKASALLKDTWQAAPELAVSIMDGHRSLQDIIPLNDISTAIATLQSNCPKAVHRAK
jgi:hypothetical protein